MSGADNESGQGGRCGAKGRSGKPCGLPAGHGTEHVGTGRCKLHGGSTPSHVNKARREVAEEAVRTFGLPVETTPQEALLAEVSRTAGHVKWLGDIVAELEKADVVNGITKTVQLPNGGRRVEAAAAVTVWVRLYQQERDRLVRVCDVAIRAGVAERAVRLAEQQAMLVADVLRGVLADMGVDPTSDEARESMRRHLTLVHNSEEAA